MKKLKPLIIPFIIALTILWFEQSILDGEEASEKNETRVLKIEQELDDLSHKVEFICYELTGDKNFCFE